MSIGFLDPALLWGLGAASLPLLVHLFFRRRPRPLAFPAFEFVLRARRQTERRLKLRRILLFLARTLVLAAVAAALARPRAETPGAAAAVTAGPAATVILLDGSGSMGWRGGGETLFERGRREALAALARLGPEEPVAALLCDGGTPAAAVPSFDRVAARQALADARPTALHADLSSCLAAAALGLGQGRGQERLGKRIVVVTDLTASAWRLEAPPPELPGPDGKPIRPEVEVVDVARGAALPNLAVTGLAAEPDAAVGPRGYRVTATVLNAGTERAAEVLAHAARRRRRRARRCAPSSTCRPAPASARPSPTPSPRAGRRCSPRRSRPTPCRSTTSGSLALQVPREVKALVVDGAPSPVKLRDEAWFVEAALGSAASPVRPTLIDAEALGHRRPARLRRGAAAQRPLRRQPRPPTSRPSCRAAAGSSSPWATRSIPTPPTASWPGCCRCRSTSSRPRSGGAAGGERGAARLARIDETHPALAVFTGEAREGLVGRPLPAATC